jgi:predicted small secreted protein
MRALPRTRWLVVLVFGGSFLLTGCDPTVREQVLSGVGAAATQLTTTLIEAFFQSLITKSQEQEEDDTQTVMATPEYTLPPALA